MARRIDPSQRIKQRREQRRGNKQFLDPNCLCEMEAIAEARADAAIRRWRERGPDVDRKKGEKRIRSDRRAMRQQDDDVDDVHDDSLTGIEERGTDDVTFFMTFACLSTDSDAGSSISSPDHDDHGHHHHVLAVSLYSLP